ncbi:fungal-specific transcription factor domain-containing protein [Mycena crocata]|nr:fungal-specific transcription factor domain-containing protein [Mycena crocata]
MPHFFLLPPTLQCRQLQTKPPQRHRAAAPEATSGAPTEDSPILQHDASTALTAAPLTTTARGPGVELPALTIRSMNTPAPAPYGDDLAHIALTEDMQALSVHQLRARFNGPSSSAHLVKATVLLREGYEERDVAWTSRRMRYWTFHPAANRPPPPSPYTFPPPDLLASLIALYFTHKNLYHPLLHRPSFERAVREGRHERDAAFGAVVLLVCAIGSRWSEDARVLVPDSSELVPDSSEWSGRRRAGGGHDTLSGGDGQDTGDENARNGDAKERDPLTVGWQYFNQLPMTLDHLFVKPTVEHLQFYCLASTFLEYSMATACWSLVGIGIRLAQDVGAHRAKPTGSRATAESELWKRAVWILVCSDRQISNSLGRPCTTQYEDFDVELPIEVDDDFWDGEPGCLPSAGGAGAFVQPPGRPSKITHFNCLVRLSNILAFSLKMLYSANKTKSLLAFRDDAWEEHIVAELDSALNGWVDSIPSHLRWDPNRRDDDSFDQSAYLHCQYYQVQITIHRPFIPMIRQGPSTVCIALLLSSTLLVQILKRHSYPAGPSLPGNLHKRRALEQPRRRHRQPPGLVLLLNVWSGKRTGLPPHMNTALAEVHKCMACICNCEHRDLLYEIAAIGQMPLPNQGSPPASAPAPGPSGTSNNHKRSREDNTAQYPVAPAVVAHHPPFVSKTPKPLPFNNQGPSAPVPPQQQQFGLPTYTADLGRLPVYHQYGPSASSSSWYPRAVGGATWNASTSTSGFDEFAPGYDAAAALDFGVGEANSGDGGAGMSRDALAMWASAPTGFEVDDWGTYFSVMSEWNQGLAPVGAQT